MSAPPGPSRGDGDGWSSSAGFVAAGIGSAVGIGNIWRFAYVAGENGGGAFLVAYVGSLLLIGLPVLLAETALGCRARGDAVSAFASGDGSVRWKYAGHLAVVGSGFVLGYYAVVAGWVLRYFFAALGGQLSGQGADDLEAYFQEFVRGPSEPLLWQALMVTATSATVAAGVRAGIERVTRILMPVLAVTLVALALFALRLPGSDDGVRFLLTPHWERLLDPGVYLAAMGQAFFSLGVGLAVFITYGSYLGHTERLPLLAVTVVVGDSLFAVCAGLAVFGAVFAFGLDPSAGAQLAFTTLPRVFSQMSAGGAVAAVFFGLLVIAALTSMIAMQEVAVSYLVRRRGWKRPAAAAASGVAALVLGLPAAASSGILSNVRVFGVSMFDAIDFSVSNLLLPTGGILVAMFVGWQWRGTTAIAASGLRSPGLGQAWLTTLRFVSPALILAIVLGPALLALNR